MVVSTGTGPGTGPGTGAGTGAGPVQYRDRYHRSRYPRRLGTRRCSRPHVSGLAHLRMPLPLPAAPPRVAIVGGGIGGAATAHFLLALRPDVRIDLFEASEKVGGRAHTLDAKIFGVPIDGGATSIFSKNKYLVSFVEKFGLAKAQDSGKDVIGL